MATGIIKAHAIYPFCSINILRLVKADENLFFTFVFIIDLSLELNRLVIYILDLFFQLFTRYVHISFTAVAFYSDIRADTKYRKLKASARVRLFHAENIPRRYLNYFHNSP